MSNLRKSIAFAYFLVVIIAIVATYFFIRAQFPCNEQPVVFEQLTAQEKERIGNILASDKRIVGPLGADFAILDIEPLAEKTDAPCMAHRTALVLVEGLKSNQTLIVTIDLPAGHIIEVTKANMMGPVSQSEARSAARVAFSDSRVASSVAGISYHVTLLQFISADISDQCSSDRCVLVVFSDDRGPFLIAIVDLNTSSLVGVKNASA
jgi:hypothetical protein